MMQLVPVSNERCEYAYYMMWDNNNINNTMRMRWYAWAVQLSKNIIHPWFYYYAVEVDARTDAGVGHAGFYEKIMLWNRLKTKASYKQ